MYLHRLHSSAKTSQDFPESKNFSHCMALPHTNPATFSTDKEIQILWINLKIIKAPEQDLGYHDVESHFPSLLV